MQLLQAKEPTSCPLSSIIMAAWRRARRQRRRSGRQLMLALVLALLALGTSLFLLTVFHWPSKLPRNVEHTKGHQGNDNNARRVLFQSTVVDVVEGSIGSSSSTIHEMSVTAETSAVTTERALTTETADRMESAHALASYSPVPASSAFESKSSELENDILMAAETATPAAKTSQPLERFLFHLPHSGFSNQVNALENALVLAHLLNRTLVVPPVLLGLREVSWAPFHRLRQFIRRVEESLVGYPLIDNQPTGMLRRFEKELRDRSVSKAIVPLASFFDLDRLSAAAGVPLVTISEFMRRGRFFTRADAWLVDDQVLYDYRYFDRIEAGDSRFLVDNHAVDLPETQTDGVLISGPGTTYGVRRYLEIRTEMSEATIIGRRIATVRTGVTTTSAIIESRKELDRQTITIDHATSTRTIVERISLDKFRHCINLEAPLPRPDVPLVLQGTAFGSPRIILTKPENIALRQRVRQALIYSNPVLEEIVDRIIAQIGPGDGNGGAGSYIGIHLRMGDGAFREQADQTVQRMVDILQRALNGTLQISGGVFTIRRPLHVFLSTDAISPVTNELLGPLRDLVDRMWTLSEFADELVALAQLDDARVTDPLNAVSRITDRFIYGDQAPDVEQPGASLSPDKPSPLEEPQKLTRASKVWIPFVDQMVASRGFAVLGTRASTFTGFLERLHRSYWTVNSVNARRRDGLDNMGLHVHGTMLGKV